MKRFSLCCLVDAVFLAALVVVPAAKADITLPKVIGRHMVLQRDQPLPIWGWAESGEEVTVKLDEATATTKADVQGNWKVVLGPLKADGKTHSMTVSGKNKVELDDILIGDVWLGSGQSNMEMAVRASSNAEETMAAAKHPQIRLLHVKSIDVPQPARDIGVLGGADAQLRPAWKACSPASVVRFSGVLYAFGQRLHQETGVPIGLIHSTWGGTPIEDWVPGGGKYNGMIVPVKPLALRGVIWYQGESNVGNGLKYADKMKFLIEGWRQAWGYEFPFYFVQIAPFSGYKPGELPPLWEAQVASLKIPKTGMVVTTDLVENIADIHPKNKVDVGNRLALWALAKQYGKKDLVCSGPLYKSMKAGGDKIRLSFSHVGGGLKSRDGKPLSEFEIAGADDKFSPATAAIDGDSIIVQSQNVRSPTQVRFGWRNEANPNLVSQEGLPASPFQTKSWQGGTGTARSGDD